MNEHFNGTIKMLNRSLSIRALVAACLLGLLVQVGFAQTATYEIIFEGTWNSADHPFPGGAHFSPLVGASHNSNVELWSVGGLATLGIERMAETGSTVSLRNEVNAFGAAASLITGAGLGAAGTTSVTVDVDISRPLVSLVTMIAPSPDWFVGTSGFDLRPNGQWLQSTVYDLPNYDAGTDNGPNFTSSNNDTNPQEPIALLGSPLGGLPPIGTFTFNLLSLTGVTGDFDGDGDYALSDVDALVAEIIAGTNPLDFDLTSDGIVDSSDLMHWLAEAGAAENPSGNPYLIADANLNGAVDVTDFNIWNSNKFTSGGLWSGGDFNADGGTDVADFNLYNANKFMSSDGVNAVPEPAAISLLAIASLAYVGFRRRRNK